MAARSSKPSAGNPAAVAYDLSPQEKVKSWTPLELLQVENSFRNCGKRYVQDRRWGTVMQSAGQRFAAFNASFRRHFLRTHTQTFLGSDFCTWLVSDSTASEFHVTTRQAALACGMAMFQNKVASWTKTLSWIILAYLSAPQIAHHVSDEHGFEDTDKYFYRFFSDEAPKVSPRPEKKESDVTSDSACALQPCVRVNVFHVCDSLLVCSYIKLLHEIADVEKTNVALKVCVNMMWFVTWNPVFFCSKCSLTATVFSFYCTPHESGAPNRIVNFLLHRNN
jgi:hypothetical protein